MYRTDGKIQGDYTVALEAGLQRQGMLGSANFIGRDIEPVLGVYGVLANRVEKLRGGRFMHEQMQDRGTVATVDILVDV